MSEVKNSLVQFLIKRNREQSAAFTSPDAVLWRRLYRAKHPTEIAALKCMDGRLNLALMTETPPGIVQPFRNIGGKFDLGWPYFGILMREWVESAADRGRNALVLVTYHFSKGDKHRGCKGFNNETAAAKAAAEALRGQFEAVFGTAHHVVYPIVVGIETDSDTLVVHGANGAVLDMFDGQNLSHEDIPAKLHEMFPDMQQWMIYDLAPLLIGNQRHIKKVQAENRTILDSEHREQILGVGRGFDWLHLPNKALIVGPYSYDLRAPISTAAAILLDNLKNGRIPKDEGVVVLSSAVYSDPSGIEPLFAREKAKSLASLAFESIKEDVPELMPYLESVVGTVDLNTRAFEKIS